MLYNLELSDPPIRDFARDILSINAPNRTTTRDPYRLDPHRALFDEVDLFTEQV